MKAAAGEAMIDRSAAIAEREKLAASYHPVLTTHQNPCGRAASLGS